MSDRKAKMRARLFERDGNKCHLCGLPMSIYHPNHPLGATIDHLIPRSQGGNNDISNLKLAHKRCNEARADAPLGEIA